MTLPRTEGERWAAEALTTLREAGFAPAAVATFLGASLQRAHDTRAAQPELRRQSRKWIVAILLGTLVVREAAVGRGAPAPSRTAAIGWGCALALMLDWHLGMVEGLDGESRGALIGADALTLTRAALAPMVAAAPPHVTWFSALLLVAALTDLLDGQLARRSQPSRFGRDFDSLADSAFRMAAIRGAHRERWIDKSAYRAFIGRQALLAALATTHWFGRSQRPPEPSPVTRWHVPLMLGGLAVAARGRQRIGTRVLNAAALLGSIDQVWSVAGFRRPRGPG